LVILDIPLHRNSTSAHSGRSLGEEEKQRRKAEFVDDLPLGKSDSMTDLLTQYRYILRHFSELGALAIVKVIEPWRASVVHGMWLLARVYRSWKVVTNPYSKTLSREVYLLLEDRLPDAEIIPEDVVRRTSFVSSLIRFNDAHCFRLNFRMMEMANKWGRVFRTVRKINCRKKLQLMRSVGDNDLIVYHYEYVSMVPPPSYCVRVAPKDEDDCRSFFLGKFLISRDDYDLVRKHTDCREGVFWPVFTELISMGVPYRDRVALGDSLSVHARELEKSLEIEALSSFETPRVL